MGELTSYADLSDLDLPIGDAIRLRWHRAMILACFYNPVKVRQHAEKIETILERADHSDEGGEGE